MRSDRMPRGPRPTTAHNSDLAIVKVGVVDALTVEAVEDDVFERDGLDRVELIREPLRGEVEPAGDDAVAGEAGKVDFHVASVGLRSSAGHAPNVRLRPGPVARSRVAARTTGRWERCGLVRSGGVVGGGDRHAGRDPDPRGMTRRRSGFLAFDGDP